MKKLLSQASLLIGQQIKKQIDNIQENNNQFEGSNIKNETVKPVQSLNAQPTKDNIIKLTQPKPAKEAWLKMPEKTRNSIDNFFNAYKLNGVENNKETNSYSSSQPYKENKNDNLVQNNFETGLDKVNNNDTNPEIKPIKLPKVKTEKIDNNYESPKLLNANSSTTTNNNSNQTDTKLTPKYFNTGEKYTPTNGEKKAGDWLVANGVLGSREEQENMKRNLKYNDYMKQSKKEGEILDTSKLMNTTSLDIKSLYNSGELSKREALDLLNAMINQVIDELRDYNPNVDDNDISKIKDYLSVSKNNMTPNEAIKYMSEETKFKKLWKDNKVDIDLLNKLNLTSQEKKTILGVVNKKVGEKGGQCIEYSRQCVGLEAGTNSVIGEKIEDRKKKFVEKEPNIGGLVFFTGGGGYDTTFGHVVHITNIDRKNGKILINESNYNRDGFINEPRWVDYKTKRNENDKVSKDYVYGFYNNTPLAKALKNR